MNKELTDMEDIGPVVMDTVDGLAEDISPSRDTLISFIFDDQSLRDHLRQTAKASASDFVNQETFLNFCVARTEAFFDSDDQAESRNRAIEQIKAFHQKSHEISERFKWTNKPEPTAIFWPDPTRGGAELRNVLPVAKRYPFIDQSTVIGSAGSCFAVEIAQNLISRGFNYLCLEKTFDPESGTYMLGSDPENPVIQYSCRWGILFNTPSFTQMVENAFGVRPLPDLVLKLDTGEGYVYIDPYRESVAFPSLEAYRIEHQNHLANTRKVFEQAEVFILTLGLNEAWQYAPDSSYISRNPRNAALNGLLDHRALTVQENVDYLQRFVDVVRTHNPNIKLIITVSPVPFMATGRADEYHVVTANTHSKSVLRVTAQEIVDRNEGIYYFPSYEVVTVCSPEIWMEDQRHIHPDAIAQVMKTFDEMFLTRGARTVLRVAEGT